MKRFVHVRYRYIFPRGIFHPNLIKFKNDENVYIVLSLCHHTVVTVCLASLKLLSVE